MRTCVICRKQYDDALNRTLDNPYGDEEILVRTVEDVCQDCVSKLVVLRKEDVESMRQGNVLFAIPQHHTYSHHYLSACAFIKKD